MTLEVKYRYKQLGEKSSEVIFRKSLRARYIRISVNSRLQVKITVPQKVKFEAATKFFESKIFWVMNSIIRMKARNRTKKVESLKELSAEEFLEKNQHLIKRCKYLAAKYQFNVGTIFLKRQKKIGRAHV